MTSMNHIFSRSLVWRHYWDQAVELSFVSFTCVEKAWMERRNFLRNDDNYWKRRSKCSYKRSWAGRSLQLPIGRQGSSGDSVRQS